MSTEQKPGNQIATLDQKIAQAKNVKELFALPDVKDRFIKNYEAVTGRKDGENRLEQERFAYLQLLAEKPDLQQVDKFFHFAALVYAGTTGLSFRDNKLYVFPNGKGGLKVQSSPAGKREMFEMMPDVAEAPEATLVMVGDIFIEDKLTKSVKVHESTKDSKEEPTLENIRAAYQRIIYKNGKVKDVIVYKADLLKAKSKTKAKSDEGFWQQWPGEACKKVATNRAFRLYHKYPDNVVVYGDQEDEDAKDVSHTDVTDNYEATQPAYSETASGEPVDTDTGEVYEPTVVAPAEPEQKKQKKQRNLLDED